VKFPRVPVRSRRFLAAVLAIFLAFGLVRMVVARTFVVVGDSMEGTLMAGDFVLATQLVAGGRIPFSRHKLWGIDGYNRNDVVTLSFADGGATVAKRLVGLPGDTIEMRDGSLLLNGATMEEPYRKSVGAAPTAPPDAMSWQLPFLDARVDPAKYLPDRENWGPLVLPTGHFFVLGDNRNVSRDSRDWGLIEGWRLGGRVSLVLISVDVQRRRLRWNRTLRRTR